MALPELGERLGIRALLAKGLPEVAVGLGVVGLERIAARYSATASSSLPCALSALPRL